MMGTSSFPIRVLALALAVSIPAGIDAGFHTPYVLEILQTAPITEWKFPVSEPGLSLRYAFMPKGTNGKFDGKTEVDVAVVGDSFAHPLVGVFSAFAKDTNMKVLMASSPSCAAFFDKVALDTTTPFDNHKKDKLCKIHTRPAMRSMIEKTKAKVVVLSGNWAGAHQIWRAEQDPKHGTSLQETIGVLRRLGSKVIVVGMVPGSHHDVAECIAKKGLRKCKEKTPVENLRSKLFSENTRRLQTGRNRLRNVIRRIMKEEVAKNPTDVAYVDVYEALCPNKKDCMNVKGKQALYYDDHHLTSSGGLALRPAFDVALKKLKILK